MYTPCVFNLGMEASVSIGIPFVLVFPGRSGFCDFESDLSWCPAKLGSGCQIFRAFKFDIYDCVYEHCEFPAVEENIRE
jgi:hypothetical protein